HLMAFARLRLAARNLQLAARRPTSSTSLPGGRARARRGLSPPPRPFSSPRAGREGLVVESARDRILSRGTARTAVRAAQRRGERVVFTNGCFDLLHVGHV